MLRTPAQVTLLLLWDGEAVLKQRMHRDHLPQRAPLPPAMERILAMDKRRPGERRPKRLHLGPYKRDPYVFHRLKLPGSGLPLPGGELAGHLGVELWVEARQPLWDHNILLYLKGSEARPHPFGPHIRWVAHRHWTAAEQLARLHSEREESPCGRFVRQRCTFLPQPELEHLGPWYHVEPGPLPAEGC